MKRERWSSTFRQANSKVHFTPSQGTLCEQNQRYYNFNVIFPSLKFVLYSVNLFKFNLYMVQYECVRLIKHCYLTLCLLILEFILYSTKLFNIQSLTVQHECMGFINAPKIGRFHQSTYEVNCCWTTKVCPFYRKRKFSPLVKHSTFFAANQAYIVPGFSITNRRLITKGLTP